MKVNTAVKKRIKISKNGKIRARKPKQTHYNAKESRESQITGKHGYQSADWLKKHNVIARFLGKKYLGK
jgi:ribosomal protein L35